jgi:aminopeptidase N
MRARLLLPPLVIILAATCLQPVFYPVTPSLPSTVQETTRPKLLPDPSLISITWDDRSAFRNGLSSAQRGILEGLPGATIYHISLKLSDDMTTLVGAEELRYTNTEDIPLDRLDFHLYPNILGGEITVASLTLNGKTVTPSFEFGNSLMRIPCDQPLVPGEQVVITMLFEVRIPTRLDTSYGILASADGVVTLAHVYPMVAVYDDGGWDEELPAEYGDIVNNDASFYIARVTAPKALTLVASGREIERKEDGSDQVVTFAAGPARDFYIGASQDYEKLSTKMGEVTINTYTAKNLQAKSRAALEEASEAIKLYDVRYGSYPYTELDIITTPTSALGIEYPGVVALSRDLFEPSASPVTLESTVAHEVGHQWFYNLVGNNQLDDPWLDESLTQFVTWQYFIDRYGADGGNGFKQALSARWDRVNDEKIPIGQAVHSYTEKQYGAIVYGRGAFFFDALRQEMGDSRFDSFIRDYVESYSWAIATTDGLRSLAEKHCECNLTPLFQEWVYTGPR